MPTVARRGVSGCRAVSTELDTAAQRSLLSATHSTRYDHTCEPSRRSSANPHCPISVLLLAARSALRFMNDSPWMSLDCDCGKFFRLSNCLHCIFKCEVRRGKKLVLPLVVRVSSTTSGATFGICLLTFPIG